MKTFETRRARGLIFDIKNTSARFGLLFYGSPIVCGGSVLVFVFVFITLCPFLSCHHIDEEERAVAFHLLFFKCNITINNMWLFLKVLWVGL